MRPTSQRNCDLTLKTNQLACQVLCAIQSQRFNNPINWSNRFP